jgi:hypothetical protein
LFSQPTIGHYYELAAKTSRSQGGRLLNSSGCASTQVPILSHESAAWAACFDPAKADEEGADASTPTRTKKGEGRPKFGTVKYRRMEAVTIEQRLVARRSHIHGWGLFTNNTSSKTIPL